MMLFNPFDALGIHISTATVINKETISLAFKRACLLRHPDHCSADARDRFPQIHHMVEARQYLEQSLDLKDLGRVVEEFISWPQTFDYTNRKNPFTRPITDSELIECKECFMIMKKASLELHVSDHDQTLCQYCQSVFSYGTFHGHLIVSHQHYACEICQDVLHITKRAQHRSYHECPFCPALVTKCGLMAHVEKDHCGKRCSNCPQGSSLTMHRELIRHLMESEHHVRIQCQFCDHEQFLFDIKKHLEFQHGIQPCVDCDPQSRDFVDHISHVHGQKMCPICESLIAKREIDVHLVMGHKLRECNDCGLETDINHIKHQHRWKECPQCSCIVEEWAYQHHLLTIHSWKKCFYCEYLTRNDATLLDHVNNHGLRSCDECLDMVVEHTYDEHLRETHGMKDCLFCKIYPLPLELLRDHVMEYHCHMEKCPECHEFQTPTALPSHLQGRHGWQKCHFCEDVTTRLSAEIHLQHHQPVTCSECGVDIPQKDLNQHLITKHHYHVQPPTENGTGVDKKTSQSSCENSSRTSIPSETEMSRKDIGAEKIVYGRPGYCDLCQKEYKDIGEHLRRQHHLRKRDGMRFKGERVKCVNGVKEHSKANVNRCKLCRKAKTSKTSPENGSSTDKECRARI